MIPKKPAPDLIRGGYRFSEEIMLKQRSRVGRSDQRLLARTNVRSGPKLTWLA
jgi:hypothetical protein